MAAGIFLNWFTVFRVKHVDIENSRQPARSRGGAPVF